MSAHNFIPEEKLIIVYALNKVGLTYQFLGHYSPTFVVKLEKNLNMLVNAVKNYSDTTGVKDFTGVVFTVWKNGCLIKTFTSPDKFVAGFPQIELEMKLVKDGKRLNEIEKDFLM